MRLTKQLFTIAMAALLSPVKVGAADQEQEYEPFIVEDRVWEYAWTNCPYGDTVIVYQMRFDGTVEINGKTYSCFVNFSAVKYKTDYKYGGIQGEATPVTTLPTSYYREEGQTVYMLMENVYTPWEDFCPAEGEIKEEADYWEAVMMDFSLPDGAVFPPEIFIRWDGDGVETEPMYVHYMTRESEETGVERRYFRLKSSEHDNFYRPEFGEGIGLTNGILPTLELYWTTSMSDDFLLSVRQGEEFIHKAWFYDFLYKPDGVDAVENEAQELELRDGMVSFPGAAITLFDASGRKVAAGQGSVSTAGLQPGIYLATAGAKTLKILVR